MSEPTETTPLSPEGEEDTQALRIAKLQTWACVGAHVWAIAALVSEGVWFAQHRGIKNVFNWHPLLMVVGFCFMTVSTLSFKHYSCMSRDLRKTLHGVGWFIMIILGTLAMLAVVTQHNRHPYAHMVSLHSWMGLFTVLFYLVQFFFGTYAYGGLFPNVSIEFKKNLMAFHKWCGITLYQITAVVMLLGIQEKEGFLPTNCEYHITQAQTNIFVSFANLYRIPAECKSAHVLGFSILVMSVLTSFAVFDFGKKSK